MSKSSSLLLRSVALGLAHVLLVNTAFAARSEINFWAERQKARFELNRGPGLKIAGMTNLPDLQEFGSIREVIPPKNNKSKGTVLFIQDVHMNPEAQANIGKAVRKLADQGNVGALALEGMFAPLALGRIRSSVSPSSLRKVSDYHLRTNGISGALHAALTSNTLLDRVVGIDDEALYNANVEAYRLSAPNAAALKRETAIERTRIAGEKAAVFNPELKRFDANVAAYRDGHIRIGKYLETLSAGPRSLPPEVKKFLEAFRLESTLDFDQAELERTQMVERMAKDGRVSIEIFPALNAYLRYARLSESLNAEDLFKEMKQMENAGYSAVIKTEEERRLIEEDRQAYLTGKLLDFSLTSEEWKEFRGGKEPAPLRSFKRFYELAEKRDEAMAQHFLRTVTDGPMSILVTGGFHSYGMTERLVEAGFAVVSFVPRVTKVDAGGGSAYLSAFAQKKAPLSKLFEGQKLFLAPLQTEKLPDVVLGAHVLGGTSPKGFSITERSVKEDHVEAQVRNNDNGMAAKMRIDLHVQSGDVTAINSTPRPGLRSLFSSVIDTVKEAVQNNSPAPQLTVASNAGKMIGDAVNRKEVLAVVNEKAPEIAAMLKAHVFPHQNEFQILEIDWAGSGSYKTVYRLVVLSGDDVVTVALRFYSVLSPQMELDAVVLARKEIERSNQVEGLTGDGVAIWASWDQFSETTKALMQIGHPHFDPDTRQADVLVSIGDFKEGRPVIDAMKGLTQDQSRSVWSQVGAMIARIWLGSMRVNVGTNQLVGLFNIDPILSNYFTSDIPDHPNVFIPDFTMMNYYPFDWVVKLTREIFSALPDPLAMSVMDGLFNEMKRIMEEEIGNLGDAQRKVKNWIRPYYKSRFTAFLKEDPATDPLSEIEKILPKKTTPSGTRVGTWARWYQNGLFQKRTGKKPFIDPAWRAGIGGFLEETVVRFLVQGVVINAVVALLFLPFDAPYIWTAAVSAVLYSLLFASKDFHEMILTGGEPEPFTPSFGHRIGLFLLSMLFGSIGIGISYLFPSPVLPVNVPAFLAMGLAHAIYNLIAHDSRWILATAFVPQTYDVAFEMIRKDALVGRIVLGQIVLDLESIQKKAFTDIFPEITRIRGEPQATVLGLMNMPSSAREYQRALVREKRGERLWVKSWMWAAIGGFVEDTAVRFVLQIIISLFAPLEIAIGLYGFLFASVLFHKNVFIGGNPRSVPPSLSQRISLFLLSVGIGAGGMLVAELASLPFFSLPVFLSMGFFHATFNALAHFNKSFLGMTAPKFKFDIHHAPVKSGTIKGTYKFTGVFRGIEIGSLTYLVDIDENIVHILNMTILPEYQEYDVAQQILKRLFQRLAVMKAGRVQAVVPEHSVDSQMVLRSMDFRKTKTLTHYFGTGEDGYLFVLTQKLPEALPWSDVSWFWDLTDEQRAQLLNGIPGRPGYMFKRNGKADRMWSPGIKGIVQGWRDSIQFYPNVAENQIPSEDYFKQLGLEFSPDDFFWTFSFWNMLREIWVDKYLSEEEKVVRLMAVLMFLERVDTTVPSDNFIQGCVESAADKLLASTGWPQGPAHWPFISIERIQQWDAYLAKIMDLLGPQPKRVRVDVVYMTPAKANFLLKYGVITPQKKEEIEKWIKKDNTLNFVAEFQGRPVGLLLGAIEKGGAFRIHLIQVHPRFRRHGVGSQLFAHLTSRKKTRSTWDYYGSVSERDLPAHFFLQKMGFQWQQTEKNAYEDGSDGYIFVRNSDGEGGPNNVNLYSFAPLAIFFAFDFSGFYWEGLIAFALVLLPLLYGVVVNLGGTLNEGAPDAVVLQLEVLPLVNKPGDETGLQFVVDPHIRALVRRHLSEGRPVAIMSKAPLERLRGNMRWDGLKNLFIDPFLEDLEQLPEGFDVEFLSRIRFYTDWGANEFGLVERELPRPEAEPRFQIRILEGHQFKFLDPPVFLQKLKAHLAAQQWGLKKELSLEFSAYEITLTNTVTAEEVHTFERWVQAQGNPDAAVYRISDNRIAIAAAAFPRAFRRFGQFILQFRDNNEPPHKILVLDHGVLHGLERLGIVSRNGKKGILHFQYGSPIDDHTSGSVADEHRRTSTADPQGVALSLIETVNKAFRAGASTTDPTSSVWGRLSGTKLDAPTLLALQKTFGAQPPQIMMTDLNRALTKGNKPVSEAILLAILNYLNVNNRRNYMAVFSETSLPDIHKQFLKALVAMAAERGQLLSLENLWIFSENGAALARFESGKNRFRPNRAASVPLSVQLRANHLGKRVLKWLLAQGVSASDVRMTKTNHRISLRFDQASGLAMKLLNGLKNRLNSNGKNNGKKGGKEKWRVNHNGPHAIVISTRDKRDAAALFLNSLPVTDEIRSKPLIISAYSGSLERQIGAHVGSGMELSLREVAAGSNDPFQLPNYLRSKLQVQEEVRHLLRSTLRDGTDGESASPIRAPPLLSTKNGPRLYDAGVDRPLRGSFGTFHAGPSLQWITENPPKILFFFSGGGGGDSMGVNALVRQVRLVYEYLKKEAGESGRSFEMPLLVEVESTVKRGRENPFGGAPPFDEWLRYYDDKPNGKSKKISPIAGHGRATRHFYKVPDNFFINYPLPDENGDPKLPFSLEMEWSAGQAAPQIRQEGSEFWIFDGHQTPEDIAKDLVTAVQAMGFKPEEMGVVFMDAGGDSLARLSYDIRKGVFHPEEPIRSATTDTMSISTLYSLIVNHGVERTTLAVAGLGRDGELGWTLFEYLMDLLDSGAATGVLDTVGFLKKVASREGQEKVKALLDGVINLKILSESSRVFVEGIRRDVLDLHSRSYFDLLMHLDVKALYRKLMGPSSRIPMISLRRGTRRGILPRVTQMFAFFDPMKIFMDLGFPVYQENGSYQSARYELPRMTWDEMDRFIRSFGYATETIEADRVMECIDLTYDMLFDVFKQIQIGKRKEALGWKTNPRTGQRYRVKGVRGGPLGYLNHENPLVRVAAAAALGPAHWRKTESLLWDIIDRSHNPFLIAKAFEAMADAGKGQKSSQLERLAATVDNPHHQLEWEESPNALGQDRARVVEMAAKALRSFHVSTTLVAESTRRSVGTGFWSDVVKAPDHEFLKIIYWAFHWKTFFREHPGRWWQQVLRSAGLLAIHGAMLAPPLLIRSVPFGIFWCLPVIFAFVLALVSPQLHLGWKSKLLLAPVYGPQFLVHAVYNLIFRWKRINAPLTAKAPVPEPSQEQIEALVGKLLEGPISFTSEVMEIAFENILNPFVWPSSPEKKPKALDQLKVLFGDQDNRLVKLLEKPNTFVVFLDKEIQKMDLPLRIPQPDVAVVHINTENSRTFVDITFIDFKIGGNHKSRRQINPNNAPKRKTSIGDVIRNSLSKEFKEYPENIRQGFREYVETILKPVRKTQPDLVIDNDNVRLHKGFFVVLPKNYKHRLGNNSDDIVLKNPNAERILLAEAMDGANEGKLSWAISVLAQAILKKENKLEVPKDLRLRRTKREHSTVEKILKRARLSPPFSVLFMLARYWLSSNPVAAKAVQKDTPKPSVPDRTVRKRFVEDIDGIPRSLTPPIGTAGLVLVNEAMEPHFSRIMRDLEGRAQDGKPIDVLVVSGSTALQHKVQAHFPPWRNLNIRWEVHSQVFRKIPGEKHAVDLAALGKWISKKETVRHWIFTRFYCSGDLSFETNAIEGSPLAEVVFILVDQLREIAITLDQLRKVDKRTEDLIRKQA